MFNEDYANGLRAKDSWDFGGYTLHRAIIGKGFYVGSGVFK